MVVEGRFWFWKEDFGFGSKILVVKEGDFGCGRKILVVEGRFWLWKEDFGCGRKILVAEGRFWLWKDEFGCGRKILVVEGRFWLWKREILVVERRFWLWKGKYGRTTCKICEVGFSKMNFKRAKGLICNSDPIDYFLLRLEHLNHFKLLLIFIKFLKKRTILTFLAIQIINYKLLIIMQIRN